MKQHLPFIPVVFDFAAYWSYIFRRLPLQHETSQNSASASQSSSFQAEIIIGTNVAEGQCEPKTLDGLDSTSRETEVELREVRKEQG